MWHTIRSLFANALRALGGAWRSLTVADVVYKIIAFAVLIPLTTGALYLLRAGTSHRVVADVDIALFFFTTPTGIATLILGASLFVAITMIETACLMGIGLCASRDVTLDAPSALRFAARHAFNVLRLTAHMVIRVLGGLIPFALAGGAVYLVLLRSHDINYYLTEHPWQFWLAAILVGALAAVLVALLGRMIARWALAMPLVVFENVSPRHALAESANRSTGSHALILTTLAIWVVIALTLLGVSAWLVEYVGLLVAPQFAGSIVALLCVVAGLALVGLVLTIAIGIINVSLFSLLITQLYVHLVGTKATILPEPHSVNIWRLSARAKAWTAGIAVLAAISFGLFAFLTNRGERPAFVIAHRGSSAVAPENTLAAFNLAARQQTDFIELDVQESSDGQVIVAHDSDLMKVGHSPLKIWDADAATLRSIDIGTFKDPKYATERVPTLAEALAACKGRCHVVVELKSYGHSQNLEERVAAIVEEAGMANDCVFMSLDHHMVNKMKSLRPSWRVGLLVAKAIGDLTELKADFLAVEARMATRTFIRRAHRAGQDVYIWTVNDPAWMFLGLSRGVDGLITDKPDIARNVIEMRAGMTEPQRFLLAVLIRLGASTEMLEAENALRP